MPPSSTPSSTHPLAHLTSLQAMLLLGSSGTLNILWSDMLLPAITSMQQDLGTSATAVQQTISLYFVATGHVPVAWRALRRLRTAHATHRAGRAGTDFAATQGAKGCRAGLKTHMEHPSSDGGAPAIQHGKKTFVRDFEGKIIYITGGASGIGLEAGKRLAGLGANIVVFCRNPTDDAHSAIESRASRLRNAWLAPDRHRQPPRRTANHRSGSHGGRTAGYRDQQRRHCRYRRICDDEVRGLRLGHASQSVRQPPCLRGGSSADACTRAGPHRAGCIHGGVTPVYGYTDYGMSKYAVMGFGECLRYELKPLGIDVALVCPGEVETPMIQAERQTPPGYQGNEEARRDHLGRAGGQRADFRHSAWQGDHCSRRHFTDHVLAASPVAAIGWNCH